MAQVGERSYPLASRTTIVVWLSIAVRAGLVLAGPGCRRNMLLAVAAFFIGRTEKALVAEAKRSMRHDALLEDCADYSAGIKTRKSLGFWVMLVTS